MRPKDFYIRLFYTNLDGLRIFPLEFCITNFDYWNRIDGALWGVSIVFLAIGRRVLTKPRSLFDLSVSRDISKITIKVCLLWVINFSISLKAKTLETI